MIDRKLLEILACPVTKQTVSELSPEKLASLNSRIAAGEVVNHGGEAIAEQLRGALITRNGGSIYPIVDNIPVMLEDQSIDTVQLGDW